MAVRSRIQRASTVAVVQLLEDRVLLAADFVVDTMSDTVDANVGDGLAEDANGDTSLRAAIMEANALAGVNTIEIGAGLYTLSLAGSGEDAAATGDLDITDDLILIGAGSADVTIDADGLDRVFQVHAGVSADLSGFTATGGSEVHGGGILNANDASLILEGVAIQTNTATEYGGGIANLGVVQIFGGSLSGNTASEGGGLANLEGADATLTGVTVSLNTVSKEGGGLTNEQSTLEVIDGQIIDNHSDGDGGGIFNWAGTVTVSGTHFTDNTANRSGGGIENTGNTIGDPGAYPGGIANVSASTFSGNSAGDVGGAITNRRNSTLDVQGSGFDANSAAFGGAIANHGDTAFDAGHATIGTSTFENNTADGYGGGIFGLINNTEVLASTFTGNSAAAGGGLANLEVGEMTVTGSTVSGNTGVSEGGGLANELGTLHVIDTDIIDNHTDNDGGGIFNWAGILNVTGGQFTDNSALSNGGGIENTGDTIYDPGAYPAGMATVIGTTFSGNTASENGGGISNIRNSTLIVQNSTFTSNSAYMGGGIGSQGSETFGPAHATISGSTFNTNSAWEGGGIANWDGSEMTLTTSTLTGNTAGNEGGGVTNEIGTLDVAGTNFIDNHSDNDGGGLFNWAGTVEILGSQFNENSALRHGGGIENTGNTIGDPGAFPGGTMTVVDSGFSSNTAGDSGGGIDNNRNSVLNVHEGTFTGNSANYGGGIASQGSETLGAADVTIFLSTFTGNTAVDYGGGFSNIRGTAEISESTFTGNSSHEGGAIAGLDEGEVTVINSTVSGNTAENEGGGLTNELGILNLIDSEVLDNHSAGAGGGLFNWAGTLNVSGSLISANTATQGGGGIDNTGRTGANPAAYPKGFADITTTTITDNDAELGGGVRNSRDSEMEITHSTIAFNSAVNGGGIANTGTDTFTGGELSISNSTISSNTASAGGGGLYNTKSTVTSINTTVAFNEASNGGGSLNEADGTVYGGNTIVAGNTAITNNDLTGFYNSLGNNLVGDVGDAEGCDEASDQLDVDYTTVLSPLLADNGGPTQTHALIEGGPAVDTGSNALANSPTDQRGFDRIVDGNGDSDAIVDIGAFESEGLTLVVIDDADGGAEVVSGTWGTGNSGANGTNRNASIYNGEKVIRWTFTGLVPGQYRVSTTWTPHAVRATDAPYTIMDGVSSLGTVDVNQQMTPSGSPDLTDFGVSWQDLGGAFNITGTTMIVELSNDANGYVMADAVRVERIGDLPQVIDDGDAGFEIVSGVWGTGNAGAEGDNRNASVFGGSKVARWTFTGLTAGLYRVSATWVAHPVRASDAPYTIFDGTIPFLTVDANQQQAPNDFTDQDINWEDLSNVIITGDTLVVELSNDANGYVMADAIRIERIGDLPTL